MNALFEKTANYEYVCLLHFRLHSKYTSLVLSSILIYNYTIRAKNILKTLLFCLKAKFLCNVKILFQFRCYNLSNILKLKILQENFIMLLWEKNKCLPNAFVIKLNICIRWYIRNLFFRSLNPFKEISLGYNFRMYILIKDSHLYYKWMLSMYLYFVVFHFQHKV